jgi:hypothetical protein
MYALLAADEDNTVAQAEVMNAQTSNVTNKDFLKTEFQKQILANKTENKNYLKQYLDVIHLQHT